MKEENIQLELQLDFFSTISNDQQAINTFRAMTDEQKEDIIEYIQRGSNLSNIRERIEEVMETLDHGSNLI